MNVSDIIWKSKFVKFIAFISKLSNVSFLILFSFKNEHSMLFLMEKMPAWFLFFSENIKSYYMYYKSYRTIYLKA